MTYSFNKTVKIGNSIVSESSRVFIIAEAGVNHNGDMKIAKKLIDTASDARADAVKFQAFKAERLILKDVAKAPYQLETSEDGESQFAMLKKLEITKEQVRELKKYCQSKNIIFLITAFDDYSLETLDEFNLPAYKIASTDITNLPFLKRVAKKKKPIILSTGMAEFNEVEAVLKEICPLNNDIILLQCTANYPVPDEEINLNVINTYKEKFDILVGFSDHSAGVGAAPYAVAMGAKLVEKHFTLDKSLPGPDHKASLDPKELKQFVSTIKLVEKYLGSEIKTPTRSELETRKSLQKCFVASKEIRRGEILTEENIVTKRTGGKGISPIFYKNVMGKKAKRNYFKDEVITI